MLIISSVLHVKKSKERRVDFSVAILFVVKRSGGGINVFQSCCGRIRARAKKDCNVSVPRILVVMSRTVTALFAASRVSVAILFVVILSGGEINVFQSYLG